MKGFAWPTLELKEQVYLIPKGAESCCAEPTIGVLVWVRLESSSRLQVEKAQQEVLRVGGLGVAAQRIKRHFGEWPGRNGVSNFSFSLSRTHRFLFGNSKQGRISKIALIMQVCCEGCRRLCRRQSPLLCGSLRYLG